MWPDTSGNRIQAHGGSIFYEDGIYYRYGENKEFTKGDGALWHFGVRCYRSTDLYNREDLGLIIPPDTEDETSSLHPKSMMVVEDTSVADYVWLPIHFDGDRPYIEWRDEWSLDEFA